MSAPGQTGALGKAQARTHKKKHKTSKLASKQTNLAFARAPLAWARRAERNPLDSKAARRSLNDCRRQLDCCGRRVAAAAAAQCLRALCVGAPANLHTRAYGREQGQFGSGGAQVLQSERQSWLRSCCCCLSGTTPALSLCLSEAK